MKRTWIVVLLVLLVILSAMPAAATAGSIPVITPFANENLEIGVPTLITWKYKYYGLSLEPMTKSKIVLLYNNIEVGTIAENIPLSISIIAGATDWGSYVWKTGTYAGGEKMAKLGTGYSVKIQTWDNSSSGISGPFTLGVKPTPTIATGPSGRQPKGLPAITINSPKAGDKIDQGPVFYVKWIGKGNMNQNVSVALLCKGVFVATLAAVTPNNGMFNWDTYRIDLASGLYTLRVRTLDGGVEAVSGEFTIFGRF